MVTTNQIHWVAGILEGEGCFTPMNEKQTIRIRLQMTDLDVVTRFKNIVCPRKSIRCEDRSKIGHKDIYIVMISGTLAAQWMMTVYSLMGARRKQTIRESLNIWKNRQKYSPIRIGRPEGLANFMKRIRLLNLSETDIEVARIMKRAGRTEEEIM